MGPNYVVGEKHDIAAKKVPGTVLIMGSKVENISSVPCGNTVGVQGLEKVLIKSGTISSSPNAHPIIPMKFSVSAVVRRAVAPKNTAQLKKFTEGLKRLEKSDPCLQVIFSDTEMIIAGAGELHIEVALGELQDMLGEDVPFTVSPPVVGFCETVTRNSSVVCLGKSPNRHNRLYFTAEPLGEKLTCAIEQGKIELKDTKIMSHQLVEDFGWDKNSAAKIWFFSGTTCLVDTSHSVSYLHEIKDSVRNALDWVVRESVLCGEPLRGVRFNLVDALLHADTVHRGIGQIVPPARRALYAAVLSASPSMVEPVYMAEIVTEKDVVGKVYGCMAQRRGGVVEEAPKLGTPLCVVNAHLPVLESFGFAAELREMTSGRAFPQLVFHHWRVMEGEVSDEGSLAHRVVVDVRKRKGMKLEIPLLEDFNDKL